MTHDLDLERALLGLLFLRPSCVAEVAESVVPGDFYRQAHERVYRVCCDLHEARQTVTVFGVLEGLKAKGWQDEVDAQQISRFMDGVPRSTNVGTLVAQLVDYADRRTLQRVCTTAQAQMLDAPTAEEAASTLVDEVRAAIRSRSASGVTLADALAAVVNAEASVSYPPGVAPSLERMDCVFRPGELVILAGRPGQGKTALALSMARQVAEAGTQVWFASLEMTSQSLATRLLASESGVDLLKLRGARLDASEYQRVSGAVEALGGLPIAVDDYAGLSLGDLRRTVTGATGLLVVDYLQLLNPPAHTKGYRNRTQEVGALSRGLKAIAHDCGVAVLALSQLSRAVEGRSEKAPQLSDLRDSGEIEQDADQVWMVWRPPLYDQREIPDRAVLKVAKHRNGPTGSIELVFDAETVHFRERTDTDPQPVEVSSGPEDVGRKWAR